MSTDDFFKGYNFKAMGEASESIPPDAKALIEEAAVIRGWSVQSFAQVEFMLAFLVHKAGKKWDVYAPLSVKMPFKPEKRFARVREVLRIDGPLKGHSSEIQSIMDDLASFEEFRHLIVHGWSDVVRARNGLFLRWRLYQPTTENQWAMKIVTTRIETVREQGRQLVQHASSAVEYFRALFIHYDLEETGDDAVYAEPSPK